MIFRNFQLLNCARIMSTETALHVPTPPSILKPRKRPSPDNEQTVSQPLKKIQIVDSRKDIINHSAIVDRIRNVFPDHDVLSIVSENVLSLRHVRVSTHLTVTLFLCSHAKLHGSLLVLLWSPISSRATRSTLRNESLDVVVQSSI